MAKDVNKLRIFRRGAFPVLSRWAPKSKAMCPHEREAQGDSRQTQREEGDVKVEAEIGGRIVIVLFSKNLRVK